MSERNDFGSFIVGFLVGGLTGAAVALLLAPQSGEETRTVIKEKAIELKEKADDVYGEVSTKAGALASDVKIKADDLSKEAAKKAAELKAKGQALIDENKVKLTKLAKGTKDKGTEIPA